MFNFFFFKQEDNNFQSKVKQLEHFWSKNKIWWKITEK